MQNVTFENTNKIYLDDIKNLDEYPYIVTIEKYSNSDSITIFRLVCDRHYAMVWTPVITNGDSKHIWIENMDFAKVKDIYAFENYNEYIDFITNTIKKTKDTL